MWTISLEEAIKTPTLSWIQEKTNMMINPEKSRRYQWDEPHRTKGYKNNQDGDIYTSSRELKDPTLSTINAILTITTEA